MRKYVLTTSICWVECSGKKTYSEGILYISRVKGE